MHQIRLTYEQWKQVHPHYRSIINRVPHVACYHDGELRLARVTFEQRTRAAASRRPCQSHLRINLAAEED